MKVAGFGAAVVFAIACGDSSSTTQNQGGGGAAGCPDNLAPATNSEFCADNPGTIDCTLVTSDKYQVCGVPLKEPPADLARATNVTEFAGSGPPDVACFQSGNYPDPPGTSSDVTVTGFARIFSSGCDSHDLKITFYRVQADGQLGDPVGTAVTTDATCVNVGESSTADNCDMRWECAYTYEGVPTETELAIRTENGAGVSLWSPLIQYNVYIPNSEVTAGSWDHDVRALAEPDYSVIPQTAIGHPIAPGNGAVAGEVHDCGDVRLENAVADIDQPKAITTYFSSNEDNPLPDQSAKGSSVLGLYAALDVPPGPVTVAAGGYVNGEFVALGQHRIWVYADAVSTVTFKGLQPYQVK
ncbi:MAG: hypothetical protein U0271_33020 [Polyangiaceae bacterium]